MFSIYNIKQLTESLDRALSRVEAVQEQKTTLSDELAKITTSYRALELEAKRFSSESSTTKITRLQEQLRDLRKNSREQHTRLLEAYKKCCSLEKLVLNSNDVEKTGMLSLQVRALVPEGIGNGVSKLLETTSTSLIANDNLNLFDVLNELENFWISKNKMDQISDEELLLKHVSKKFQNDETETCHYLANLLTAVQRFQYHSDCKLLLKVLNRRLSSQIWFV